MQKSCKECNNKINKYNKSFCSQNCYHKFKKNLYDKKYTKPCFICGKNFRHPSINPNVKTCSKECLIKLFKQRKRTQKSNIKTSNTLKYYWNIRIRKGTPHTKKEIQKIKQACKEINKGEKNGNWRGGTSKNQYRGDNWQILRKKVYQRDNYTCQICRKTKCKVESHHKIPWRKSQNNSFNNLITLCKSCHKKEDNKIIKEEKRLETFEKTNMKDPIKYEKR